MFSSLHGAMASEGEPNADDVILAKVRRLVDKDCFIGVVFNHHAKFTRQNFAAADVILGFETRPHDGFI